MAIFSYEALSADGKRQTGEVEAADRNAAITVIRGGGLKPTKVMEKDSDRGAAKNAGAAAPTPSGSVAAEPKKKGKTKGKVKSQQLSDFANQFAVLQDAGLPIVRSLKVLANQQKPGTFKAILEDVTETVESGSTLSDALAQHPNAFDNLFCNMVKAGEAGGVLDVIMNRLAGFLEKAQRLKKKVVGASVYPVVVMSVAIIILTAIIIFVVPAFETMFKAQGLDLPFPTQMLLFISRGLVGWFGLALVAVVVGTIVGVGAWRKTKGGKRKMDAIKLKLPIFGTILRKSTTSRFCRTLGTLIASGVPILESLTICRNAINNEVLGEAIDTVRASIKEGESIAAPLGKTSLFDDLVVNMIDVGEETGELDKMLVKVADNYDLEVDIAVDALMSIMEPILIVFMGGAIGFIVIALFLPLVSMIENIGG
jgi:type IV pilus assembly protein PilC